jgi:hypothetical protein
MWLTLILLIVHCNAVHPLGSGSFVAVQSTTKYARPSSLFHGGDISIPTGRSSNATVKVYVSTRIGSKYLDKKMVLTLQRHENVLDLKNEISKKFSGKPPVELQTLYCGTRKLQDTDTISNISPLNIIPIQLDMMSGTSSYERPMHTGDMIEAYCAASAQQAYLANKMAEIVSGVDQRDTENNDPLTSIPDSVKYAKLLSSFNASIHASLAERIAAAKRADSDAEAPPGDAMRSIFSYNTEGMGSVEEWIAVKPRDAAIAKLFDLNAVQAKRLLFYSGVCVVCLLSLAA